MPSFRRFPIPIIRKGKELQYLPNSDFFALGFTCKQIETLIRAHKKKGFLFKVYTTGFNVDAELIKHLSLKYPETFRLHASVITFDPAIRKHLMNPRVTPDNILRMGDVLVQPTYFFLYFNAEQVMADIGMLNEVSIKNGGRFYFHKLYYDKLSPQYIKDYAEGGEREFEKIIQSLKVNDQKLKNISKRLVFSPHSKIYAWAFREHIRDLLRRCKGTDEEAIYCSQGAYETIKSLFAGKAIHVVRVKSCFGGCVDFTLGMTVKAVLLKMGKMLSGGVNVRRIYLPNTMFCIEGKFDLCGDSVHLIKKMYRHIDVKIITIPRDIVISTLSLETCLKYYIETSEA